MKRAVIGMLGVVLLASACAAGEARAPLDTEGLPVYLHDRGTGMPISMFGTYVQKGQLIFYPFFEYYRDSNLEYKPSELGYSQDSDYRGQFEAFEQLIFFSYGVSERFAFEAEAAITQAELERSHEDNSGLPSELKESGIGDVEGQLRWRWTQETASRPEIFSWFETVIPTQNEGSLIGTTNWEFALGAGLIRGFSWGTVDARAAAGYAAEDGTFDFNEFGFDYLRRLSSSWRVLGGIEGGQDEVSLITDVQWHFSRNAFLKVNNGFGLTSKATDWAPEVGMMFSY